jgi:hypothetical protein
LAPAPACIAWGIALAVGFPTGALAQNAESEMDRRVIDLTTVQKRQTDLRDKRCFLPAEVREEIVVCAPLDPDRDRYPRRETLESVQSTKTGIPRAPDFGKPSCKGQVGCISFGKVPAIMPDIDVSALPQAPAGSDADRIAKGELKDR